MGRKPLLIETVEIKMTYQFSNVAVELKPQEYIFDDIEDILESLNNDLDFLRAINNPIESTEFGSKIWNLYHNFNITLRNAEISYFNWSETDKSFYLKSTLDYVSKAYSLINEIKEFNNAH
jgi:hypothetical protein